MTDFPHQDTDSGDAHAERRPVYFDADRIRAAVVDLDAADITWPAASGAEPWVTIIYDAREFTEEARLVLENSWFGKTEVIPIALGSAERLARWWAEHSPHPVSGAMGRVEIRSVTPWRTMDPGGPLD